MSADPGVELLLSFVHALMARRALELLTDVERHETVLNGSVALRALHVVLRDVHAMYEGRVLELGNPLGLVVAIEASSLLGVPCTRGHLIVTRRTGDEITHVLLMIHHEPRGGHDTRDRLVAPDAPGHRVTLTLLEVAEVAGHRLDREVVSLHDLRVAAGAPQLLAPSKLAEVLCVVEPDDDVRVGGPDEADRSFHLAQRVAPRPQTCGILDFGPGFGAVRARDVLHDLIGRLEFPHSLRFDAGGIVALDAGNVAVRGCRPRVVVGRHDVALVAEAGLRAVLDEAHRADRAQDDQQHAELHREAQGDPDHSFLLANLGHAIQVSTREV